MVAMFAMRMANTSAFVLLIRWRPFHQQLFHNPVKDKGNHG